MARSIPELDPASEKHAYLKRYKRARFGSDKPMVNFLYDVSALQASLVTLGRSAEAIRIAYAVRPHVPQDTLLAYEILREEVISAGAYAAGSDEPNDTGRDLLTTWGETPFGWRSRTSPKKLAGYYSILGSKKDVALEGLDGLHGKEALDRLFTLGRYLLMLFTDRIILMYGLAGVDRLLHSRLTPRM